MKLGCVAKHAARIAVSAAFLLATAAASAQYELIIIEKPFIAHDLSGVVVDPTGAPIPGARVEECEAPFTPIKAKNSKGEPTGEVLHGDCTQGTIIATSETNAHGHFSLSRANEGNTYYLHVSSPGFDPMQITVKLKFFARAGLRIQLHIAT